MANSSSINSMSSIPCSQQSGGIRTAIIPPIVIDLVGLDSSSDEDAASIHSSSESSESFCFVPAADSSHPWELEYVPRYDDCTGNSDSDPDTCDPWMQERLYYKKRHSM
jgi:hypothetical protein